MLRERLDAFCKASPALNRATVQDLTMYQMGVAALAYAILEEVDEDSGDFGQEMDLEQIRDQCVEIFLETDLRGALP